MRRIYVFVSILFVFAILLLTLPQNENAAQAQVAPTHFQYAVKFVCGKSPGEGQPEVVARGSYFTAINVHNPANNSVNFRKKIAVALPSEKPGEVSKFFDVGLGPDQALEIDCDDIFKHMNSRTSFLKGFVVIETKTALDVIAVYTAAGASGMVETMDVERFDPRRVLAPRAADLIPIPDAKGNFCRIDPATRRLIVRIRNQGSANAGGSQIKVEYSAGGPVASITPPIAAGGTVDVPVPFPSGQNCFQPDCSFKIIVDDQGQVSESNELNNTARGTCIG